MARQQLLLESIPVGTLGIIALESSESMGQKVNNYIAEWRNERESEHTSNIAFYGYKRESYLINAICPRFGTGESKGYLKETIRGRITSYNVCYTKLLRVYTHRLRMQSRHKVRGCSLKN